MLAKRGGTRRVWLLGIHQQPFAPNNHRGKALVCKQLDTADLSAP